MYTNTIYLHIDSLILKRPNSVFCYFTGESVKFSLQKKF